ncbi:MAG: pseudouridine-5'-phosphate glycosidase [Gemmatimonadota bacterium]
MSPTIDVRPEVARALEAGAAVVALESTVIAHGLPHPRGVEAALGMESAVREEGALPATIAILAGRVCVGLTPEEIGALAGGEVRKVSCRDLASVIAGGETGATTVAATARVATRAGIRVFATGGIGGVHRGGEESLDVSADLVELARSSVAVVCAGAKAILDLRRTLEMLETLGVPVIGYGTDELPAFYATESGLAVPHRADTPEEVARLLDAQWGLGPGGVVVAVPPPAAEALEREEMEALVARALADAGDAGIDGAELTPYLLAHLAEASGGRTLAANLALLARNARVAARIARAYAGLPPGA